MASLDDVARIALGLPETSERLGRGLRQWVVRGRLFVWERPLRRSDLEALGATAPDGPILGARVEHAGAKEALLADDPGVFFTTPHFDGHAIVLVRLDAVDPGTLDEVVVEAWLARAPDRLVRAFVERDAAAAVASPGSFTVTGEIWRHEGEAAWHFVSLPRAVAEQLRAAHAGEHRPFGSLPVRVGLGGSTWTTSLFRDTKLDTYLLPIRAAALRRERVGAGDTVTVRIDVGPDR